MVNGEVGRFGAPTRRAIAQVQTLAEQPRRFGGRRFSISQQVTQQKSPEQIQQEQNISRLQEDESFLLQRIQGIEADINKPREGRGIAPSTLKQLLSQKSEASGRLEVIREAIRQSREGFVVSVEDIRTLSQRVGEQARQSLRSRLGAQDLKREFAETKARVEAKLGKPITKITPQEAQQLTPQERRAVGIKIIEGKPTQIPEGAIGTAVGGGFLVKTPSGEVVVSRDGKVVSGGGRVTGAPAGQEVQFFTPAPQTFTPATQQDLEFARTGRLPSEERTIPITEDFFGAIEQSFERLPERRKQLKEGEGFERDVQQFLLGIGATTGGTLLFGRQLFKEPRETIEQTFQSIIDFGKDPSPKIKKFIAETKKVAKEEPFFLLGQIAGEVAFAKGTSEIIKFGSKASTITKTIINPDFRKIEVIETGEKAIVDIPTERGRVVTIKISPPVSRILEPLSEQAKLSGTIQDAVSAQTSLFGKILQRERVIEKPKPTPESPEIERFLFADPRARLRVSRFVSREASFLELLKGEATFRRGRPQALFFEQVEIEKLPKNLEQKFKSGKDLTPIEQSQLLEFQLKRTGKFKPIGKLTKEPEIVLPPKEIIRKRGRLGITLFEGKPIEILDVEIAKATRETGELLEKEILTRVERRQLRRRLIQETGLDISTLEAKPFFPLGRVAISTATTRSILSREALVTPNISKKSTEISTSISKAISTPPSINKISKVVISPVRRRDFVSPRLSLPSLDKGFRVPFRQPSPIGLPPSKILARAPRKEPLRFPIKTPKLRLPQGLRGADIKEPKGFTLLVRRRGKFSPIATDLPKGLATSLGADITQKTLARTFRLLPTGRRARRREQNFELSREVFREPKFDKTPLTFVERRRFALSTPTEIREIQRARKGRRADNLSFNINRALPKLTLPRL